MAFTRGLGVIGIVGISWFVAVGCGDDDGKNVVRPEAGGEGGEAPNGGKAGVAGGGKGGTTTSGAGGAIGGAGGGGESVGGSAGEPPITTPGAGAAGEGGMSGAAGADGAGGEPTLVSKQCANECEIDADCSIGADSPGACDQGTHRCYDPTFVRCQQRVDCVPAASFWSDNCEGDNDCADDDSERCVDLNGVGWCAPVPNEGCAFGVETDLPVFGSPTAMATVCAATFDACVDNICYYGCADPQFGGEFCGPGGGLTCNAASGLCECEEGSECTSTVCGADKQCAECVTDQDCIGKGEGPAVTGLDHCVAGKCGCSATAICPDTTQAATPVCE